MGVGSRGQLAHVASDDELATFWTTVIFLCLDLGPTVFHARISIKGLQTEDESNLLRSSHKVKPGAKIPKQDPCMASQGTRKPSHCDLPWFCGVRLATSCTSKKPYEEWDKPPLNWYRISSAAPFSGVTLMLQNPWLLPPAGGSGRARAALQARNMREVTPDSQPVL